MTSLKSLLAACGLSTMIGLAADLSLAASTTYPLTLENCGAQVTFQKAPERAIGLGQNSAEILLLLGLENKMA